MDWEANGDAVPDLSGQVHVPSYRRFKRGGYAMVYEGEWGGNKVAVKVLEPIGTLRSMRRKVDRERSVWASLDHPNVLPLYGFCNDSDFDPYGAFISPWCPNGDSNTYLQDMGDSLDLNERLELFCGVAKGVAYIHSLSLVHGDIKPTNILIDGEGNPRICDFGLARIYLTEGNSGFTTSTPHTGTDRYLAPELLNAIDNVLPIPTTESDVYALGCVGLKFNFLRDPYADCVNNLRAQIFDAIRQGIPPALTWSEQGDLRIREMLKCCWKFNPLERPPSSNILSMISNILNPYEGPPRDRSRRGCWTCRIRRRKCDEHQNLDNCCQSCVHLGIECLGWDENRPEWLRDAEHLRAFKMTIKYHISDRNRALES